MHDLQACHSHITYENLPKNDRALQNVKKFTKEYIRRLYKPYIDFLQVFYIFAYA